MATNRKFPTPPEPTRALQVWLVVTTLTIMAIALLLIVAGLSASYLPAAAFYPTVFAVGAAFAIGIGAIARWLVNP